MRVSFSDIDTDFYSLMVGQRVTVEIDFDIESISTSYLEGQVKSTKLISNLGMSGLNPNSIMAEKKLKAIFS